MAEPSYQTSVFEKGVKHEKLIVTAIDFGTHGSGFAFCSLKDYKKNPEKIYIQTWNSSAGMTNKTPTTVLLNPDTTFKSFGYEAEEAYCKLSPEEQIKHYLFRQFKMKLFRNSKLSETTTLKDETRLKELPAITVFSEVIKYFKTKVLGTLKVHDSESGFKYEDVYWVLTVPAIWDLKAKQFMRLAAIKAGLSDNQLSLALEPEAASLYCRKVPVSINTTADGSRSIAALGPGSKYLILDLGGGTIDMTVHQVMKNGGLREIHQACGGHWGGNRVNEEFNKLLKRLLGADVLGEVNEKLPGSWLEMCLAFETVKCSKSQRKKVDIMIPKPFLDTYKRVTECKLVETLKKDTNFSNDLFLKNERLSISKSMFDSFFQESIKHVLEYTKDLIQQSELDKDSTILAVGGYAESSLMREALRNEFTNNVIFPIDPSLAVLKGAVIYGFEPEAIGSRVCRYSYGIAHQRPFQEGDPISKKSVIRNSRGQPFCDDVFDKHVEKGQIVKVGEYQTPKEYYPVPPKAEMAYLDFYACERRDVTFIDDPDCEYIGNLIIELSSRKTGGDGKILVRLGVGGTELEVEVTEASTGNIFKTYCNFLP